MERIVNIDILAKSRLEDINPICAKAEAELKPMTAKEYDLLGEKVIIARTSDTLFILKKEGK